jgi:hypothetical protein
MWHVAQQILTAQHLCPSPWGWAIKKRDIQEQALYTGDTRRPEQGSDSSFSPQALNALQYQTYNIDLKRTKRQLPLYGADSIDLTHTQQQGPGS